MVPLVALDSGYGAVSIGVLTAVAAVSQIGGRTFAGGLMRRFTDRALVGASSCLIAAACACLVVDTSLTAFVVAQVLNGLARAFFWTGAQTHAVRTARTSVRGLALVNLSAGFGNFVGPAVAGVASHIWSPRHALAIGLAFALLGLLPSRTLLRLDTFSRRSSGGPRFVWMRRSVATGCWMNGVAGLWKGIVDSYVPVVLVAAGHNDSTVGLLVALANVAVLAGSATTPAVLRDHTPRVAAASLVASAIGIAGVGVLAGRPPLASVALAVSGFGTGLLQTLGPAVAADAVDTNERGDAIAATGLFRAAALLAAPVGMAGLVVAVPLWAAFCLAGAAVLAPIGILLRHSTRPEGPQP